MIRSFVLLLPAALLACGSGAAPQDPNAPRPGLWETRVRLGDTIRPSVSPEIAAEMKRMAESQPPRRACFPGGTPKVGDPFLGGRCTYQRVADRGERSERTVTCPSADGRTIDVIELTGTRAPERHDLRILSRRTDAASGRTLQEVETLEEGRRLGPCPGAGG